MRALVALLALTGCSYDAMSRDALYEAQPGNSAPDTGRTTNLRIDLIPSEERDAENAEIYRAMPQSLLRAAGVDSPVDVGDVTLLRPVIQDGLVEAFRVNPFIASLPGDEVPLQADVRLRRLDTIQEYRLKTDDEGMFEAWAVPGAYRLEIVPFDPLLPMFTGAWTITDPPQPIVLDLEAGVPIYGRVMSSEGPVEGARLYVEDEHGARSVTTETDENGVYQLRVTPGQWTLVCEGRLNEPLPTLRFPSLAVGETGRNVDVSYPTIFNGPGSSSYLTGEIRGPQGEPVSEATVRIVADDIDGYEAYGDDAFWSTELGISTEGGFVSPIVRGTLTVEIIPRADLALTPTRLALEVHDTGETELGPIHLDGYRELRGLVTGPNGAPLASAVVDCRAMGFDRRSWKVFTDERGEFQVDVADVELECQADPPSNRDDLARQWKRVEPGTASVAFTLPVGQRVLGKVLVDEDPEAFVVVHVLDRSGRSLGTGLTGRDGAFSIPVDLQSAQ